MNKKEEKHPAHNVIRSFRQKAADKISMFAGSWFFLILLIALTTFWITFNKISEKNVWDQSPFIMLNLILNIIMVILGPIILMSQNREEERDRLRAEYDYRLNKLAEKEIREVKKEVQHIKKMLRK